MKTLAKKERRQNELDRHYKALEALATKCGVKGADGKKLSLKLLKMERIAHKAAEDYCNGDIDEKALDEILLPISEGVKGLFGNNLMGFFINTDPRGYALKIKDSTLREEYADIGLQRDWGGYGLLSPEIQ